MRFLKSLLVAMIFGIVASGCSALINPEAKILVTRGSATIENNASVHDFSKVEVNKTSSVIFKIQSEGSKTLKLTGMPAIEILGQDNDSFTITTQPETSLKTNEWTTFELKFSPTESKFCEAVVSIANNDIDSNPFIFTVKGRGVIIDIEVRQGSTRIANDTGLFDFGTIYPGDTGPTFSFTIKNIGSVVLHLTGISKLISLQGYGSGSFLIDQTMTVSELQPGKTTTFDVLFKPPTLGIKTAKIFFENDDPDENPYSFTIKGSYLSPEIQVLDPDLIDLSNNTSEYVFPDNHLNNSKPKIFTIRNNGITDLTLRGSPIVKISGADSGAFTVQEQPEDTIAPGSKKTFVIAFKPTEIREYSATVTFSNDDQDENPFTFTVRGMGYFAECDFNGDGLDDILISAPKADVKINKEGMVYLFFGNHRHPSVIENMYADVVFTGKDKSQRFGQAITVAGDVNNDGFCDILIGDYNESDYGSAYIFFGRADPPSVIPESSADVEIRGSNRGDCFGYSVSNVGDFNNDGIDDILIGAKCDSDGATNAGCAFIFFGRNVWSSKLKASDADVKFVGQEREGNFGWFVSNAGDFNNDGFDDVIIEPRIFDEVNIFFGSSNPKSVINSTDVDVTILKENGYTYSTFKSIANAGDFNNDGFDDVIIGAPEIEIPENGAGRAYIVFGRSSPPKSIPAETADVTISGITENQEIGFLVNNAGDVNNDGCSDVLVTGERNSVVYLFVGSNNPSQHMNPSYAATTMIETYYCRNSYFHSISPAGHFTSDRFDDFILGYSQIGFMSAFMCFGTSSFPSQIELSTEADILFFERCPDGYYSGFGQFVAGGK